MMVFRLKKSQVRITDKKDFQKKKRFLEMITNKNKCVQINFQ